MFQVFLQSLAQAALERLFERNRGQYNRIEKGTKQDYLRWILYIQSVS